MHRLVLLAFLALPLTGCLDGQPSPEPPTTGTAGPAALRVDRLTWQSTTIRGQAALEVTIQPAQARCDLELRLAMVSDRAGPMFFAHRESLLDPDGDWSRTTGNGVSAGTHREEVHFTHNLDGNRTAGGFTGTDRDVSNGLRVVYIANDLDHFENPSTHGQAFWFDLACTEPVEVSFRGARQAMLEGHPDFRGGTGTYVILGPSVNAGDSVQASFGKPASWWMATDPYQVMSLTVSNSTASQRYAGSPSMHALGPLMPDDYTFALESVAPSSGWFHVAAAALEPVASMAELEALPQFAGT